DIVLSNNTVVAAAKTTVGSLTTTATGDNRMFNYTLATGVGDTDNGSFTLTSDGVLATGTDTNFPVGLEGGYNVRIRTTDAEFSSLFFEKNFQITATIPDPHLAVPPTASGVEGGPIAFSIVATPDDSTKQQIVSVTVSNVPSTIRFSAGTNNDGTWTLTPAQLAGLTLTASD